MPTHAVIKTGGKQYLVEPGKKLRIEKVEASEGSAFVFDAVLLAFGREGEAMLGKPTVANAKVEAEIVSHGRAKKVIIFRYHNKTRRRKKKGHRQPFTEVMIKNIVI